MKLYLSSDKTFYSIQGEGPTSGQRSVFLRLAKCHLGCKWCDTTEVWNKSITYSYENLYLEMEAKGELDALKNGASLIITGGAPLLQQTTLAEFIDYTFDRLRQHFRIEVETEGTLRPKELLQYVAQWNVSPKLANSGVEVHRRFLPEILRELAALTSFFKFPVDHRNLDTELAEIDLICTTCGIRSNRVWLMPLAQTRAEHIEAAEKVVAKCLEKGFNFSPRLQLLVWDRKTGV